MIAGGKLPKLQVFVMIQSVYDGTQRCRHAVAERNLQSECDVDLQFVLPHRVGRQRQRNTEHEDKLGKRNSPVSNHEQAPVGHRSRSVSQSTRCTKSSGSRKGWILNRKVTVFSFFENTSAISFALESSFRSSEMG